MRKSVQFEKGLCWGMKGPAVEMVLFNLQLNDVVAGLRQGIYWGWVVKCGAISESDLA